MSTEEKYTRITLRIPKETHQKLSDIAEETSKSMNAEIIARVESSLANNTDEKLAKIEQLCEENNEKLEEVLKRLDAKA